MDPMGLVNTAERLRRKLRSKRIRFEGSHLDMFHPECDRSFSPSKPREHHTKENGCESIILGNALVFILVSFNYYN